ncbi:hypothetical protein C0992_000445 [Termitomyces sp. T32_za158]|nr:hypothetical protein C0992_000445 [Termitomyces sp. T32_za158]
MARRTPRLSLITSTYVFSPRPSPDPRENLRVLKSPLKNTFKALKRGTTPLRTLFANASSRYEYTSPVKPDRAPLPADEDEEEDNIVLVDGNHPRVVEDEQDLVILEDIDRPIDPSLGAQHQMFLHAPQPRDAQQEPPKTPVRRRSQSLHRAVLIRSAQRAVMKAERDEREREEEEMEEMEVLDVVASLDGKNNDGEEESGGRHKHDFEQGEEDTPMDVDMDVDMEEPLAGSSDDEQNHKKHEPKQKLSWRKSFERLWPFRSSSPVKDEEDHSDDDEDNDNDNDNDNEFPAHARTSSSPIDADEEDENEDPAPLAFGGPFMTPQPRIGTSFSDPTIQRTHEQDEVGVGKGRFSLGGGEARRIVAESQVWRVKDIVVPPPSSAVGDGGGTKGAFASPVRREVYGSPRKVVDEDERKAIQERRRSALREPSGLGFVPGFSPMKMKAATRVFSGGVGSGPGLDARSISPLKPPTKPTLSNLPTEEKEEEEDTRRLLERMRQTVEGMKRRRSEVPPQVSVTPSREIEREIRRGRSPVKKGEAFSLLRTEQTEEGRRAVTEEIEKTKEVEVEEVTIPKERAEEKAQSAAESVQGVKDVCADVYAPITEDEEELTGEVRFHAPSHVSKAKSPPLITHQEQVQGMSPAHKREKPRLTSKARSPAPVRVHEAETVFMEPMRKSRLKSKAKSPAPVRVQEDKKDDAPVEESHSVTGEGTELTTETVITEPQEPEPAQPEKSASKPRSRSKSALRTPASNRRTKSKLKDSIEETTVRSRKGTITPVVEGETLQAPTKRGRKATTTTMASATTLTSSQDEPEPTRRGRKPTAELEDKGVPKRGRKLGVTTAATDKETNAPKRSLRKTPASSSTPVAEIEEPVKRGRTPHEGSVASTSKPTSKTVGVVNGDDGKVTVKGRKRAGTIKKEDDVGSVSGVSVNASNTTTTITNAMGTKSRTPAVGTRMRKTPVSVPSLPVQDVNKENENGEKGVKVRISRKGRGTKVEDCDVEIEAGAKDAAKERVGRTTRARART